MLRIKHILLAVVFLFGCQNPLGGSASEDSGFHPGLPGTAGINPTVTSFTPNAGLSAGGANITITGTNFISGAIVTVGGVPCSVQTYVNSTTMTCIVPPNALITAVNVTVTNPDATNGSSLVNFTYLGAPVLWLRSDLGVTQAAGNVSTWSDQSGYGNDATQIPGSQPTYVASNPIFNNYPTVRFAGSPQNFNLTRLDVFKNITGCAWLGALSTTSSLAVQQLWVYTTNVVGTTREAGLLNDNVGADVGTPAGGFVSISGKRVDGGNTWQAVNGGTNPGNNVAFVASANGNLTTNTASSNVDGINSSTGAGTWTQGFAGQPTSNTNSQGGIIGSGNAAARFFLGDMAELFLYNTYITNAQRAVIENYLLARYNIP